MGTPVITTLMLVATIFLIVWDYKKWIILFRQDHRIKVNLTTEPEDKFMTDPLWTVTGVIFIVLTIMPWIFNNHSIFHVWVIAMLTVGVAALAIKLWKDRLALKQSKVY
jgi:putative effector of murein hydrolase